MAVINSLTNLASVTADGVEVISNSVETLLDIPPTVVKAVDKLTAKIGDVLTYTVTITNLALMGLTDTLFSDALPDGCTYVPSSFTVNTVSATPTIAGNTLSYTIPSIAALGVATVRFQVTVIGG